MRLPKFYEMVLWEDPASDFDGWQDIGKLASTEPDLVVSVGWPVREDENYLYLAMDWSEGKCNTIGRLPKSAIRQRRRVRLRGFPGKSSDPTTASS